MHICTLNLQYETYTEQGEMMNQTTAQPGAEAAGKTNAVTPAAAPSTSANIEGIAFDLPVQACFLRPGDAGFEECEACQ